jgi:hypothetical protein
LSLALTLAGLALQVAVGWPADISLPLTLAVAGIAYAAVGARIVRAGPRNVVGWLLIGSGLSWAFTLAAVEYQALAVAGDGTLPGVVPLAWLATWSWMPGTAMFLVFIPLVFPNGRLASPRWRPFVAVVVVAVAVDVITHGLLALGHLDDLAYLANDFEAGAEPGPLGTVAGVADAWRSCRSARSSCACVGRSESSGSRSAGSPGR